MRKTLLAPMLAAVLFAAGCSSTSSGPNGGPGASAAKPAAPEIKYETGRLAFQNMLASSHLWAPDAEPIELASSNYTSTEQENTADSLGYGGKSAHWRAVFASPARGQMKPWVWSGGGKDQSAGITPGSEDVWSAGNSSTRTFNINFLKIDTSQAYDVAEKHGGAKFTKEQMPVNYSLEWDPRASRLYWHVMYGKNRNSPDLDVVVDASSGEYVRIQK